VSRVSIKVLRHTLTDHRIQIGEKMIITADHNICYAEDPPPPTMVQITSSEEPWPEVWHEADMNEVPSPNWVHTFDAEGHWVLTAGFHCFPGAGRALVQWWALFIDIDKSSKTEHLTTSDREVPVDFRLTNAAGKPGDDVVSQTITWKVTTVGEERTETRYKTLDGEPVAYQVTVKDHLVQIGDGSMSRQFLTPPPTRCTLMVAARR
jgi:hypothetical protein